MPQGMMSFGDEAQARINALEAKVQELQDWKNAQLELEREWDPQRIAKLLNLPLGCRIRREIELGQKLLEKRRALEVVHLCPQDEEETGLCPCCGKSPFELPNEHRMTMNPALVTCNKK